MLKRYIVESIVLNKDAEFETLEEATAFAKRLTDNIVVSAQIIDRKECRTIEIMEGKVLC